MSIIKCFFLVKASLRVTIGHLIDGEDFKTLSKHKANTTELHPKVRSTYLIVIVNLTSSLTSDHTGGAVQCDEHGSSSGNVDTSQL